MKRAALFFAFAAAIIFVAAYPSQDQFALIMIGMSLAFGIFSLIVLESFRADSIFPFIALGVFVRVILLFFFPKLSDDIYRFCWDGQLLHLGINPFTYLPDDLQHENAFLAQLYPSLNSKSYYSIYSYFR